MNLTDREKLAPYRAALEVAYLESPMREVPGFDRAVFAAMGYRESDWTWAKAYNPKGDPAGTGDGGHGHGLYQIDDRTWGAWLKLGTWGLPVENMRQALRILDGDRKYLARVLPTRAPDASPELALRTVIASYNAGPGNAFKGLLAGDPDERAAGGDYSAWILAKASDLRVQMPDLASNT